MGTGYRRLRAPALAGIAVAVAAALPAQAAEPKSASKQEKIGVVTGIAVGAAAGGPVGAVLGAAAGAWLGDRYHRQAVANTELASNLDKTETERAALASSLNESTAEVAMMLILGACHRAYESDQLARSGEWTGWAPTQMLGLGLSGRRLGILGLGRIGRQVAKRAAPFGLEIHYHNRRQLPAEDEAGAIYHPSSDALLRHSDIFCITAPSTPELKGFLDARRIALLPKDAVVVNVARGDMVDDEALIAALKSRRLFSAGLDVYRGEPELDPRYRTLPNAFLLPHIGSATIDTRNAMGFLLLDGLKAIEEGRRPANQVV